MCSPVYQWQQMQNKASGLPRNKKEQNKSFEKIKEVWIHV